jgi:hypothetical protein
MIVSAIRYLVWDTTGTWATGDTEQRHHIAMDWTLTLYRDAGAHWQLTSTSSPITQRVQPEPGDVGELWTGRADQSLLLNWLRRRREWRDRKEQLEAPEP